MTQPQTPSSWVPPEQKQNLCFVINITLPSPKYDVSHLLSYICVIQRNPAPGSWRRQRPTRRPCKPKTPSPSQPTLLSLKTANGRAHPPLDLRFTRMHSKSALHAKISLSSNASSRGNFHISAQTTNAPLALALSWGQTTHDSRPVILHLDAVKQHTPAHVALPSVFEGRFLLHTMHFRSELHEASLGSREG